ncbi:hypothetical protein PQG46_06395 [Aquirufa nivalisilvae]|uniref:Uncharacterized protein n=1 Tax=Aquirufa nivalisilvae TaxID=2516557 RepID=A0A2S2DXG5_9BACT|nr:hypothetical protein [Aquirufa nivalisilvae]AWL10075.1 hypothetical protein HME7025_02228 [Aquirufa nivalisilvae]
MARPAAVWINVFFRFFAALAYFFLGYYIGFWSEFQLGILLDMPTTFWLGILFMLYGIFRIWRAFLYVSETKDPDYGNYED